MQFCIEGYQRPIFVHPEKCPQVPWGVSGVSVLGCSVLSCGSVTPSYDYQPSHSSCQSVSFIILDYLSNTEPHFKRQKTKTVSSLGKEYLTLWPTAHVFCTAASLLPLPQELDAFQPYPAEIIPGKLYLGNFRQACDPKIQKDLKIKAHVNVSMETGPL